LALYFEEEGVEMNHLDDFMHGLRKSRGSGPKPLSPLILRTVCISLVMGLALGGCGRKGPLEPPSVSIPQAAQPAPETAPVPVPKKNNPIEGKSKSKDSPFFLDFLL